MSSLPDKILNHRLVLLSGAEDTLRRHALAELKERIGGDPFDLQALVAGEGTPMDWIAAVSTVPFLSGRRTVIVRNVLRVGSPADAFSNPHETLKSVPDFGMLILVADDETGDHSRQQRLDTIRKSWESHVDKAGGFVATFKIDAPAAKRELLRFAESRGKTLGSAAAELLLEMTGRSLSRALEELDKVALYVGEAENIRESDIEATTLPSREWNVFKLADSILEGNAGLALSQLRALVGSGTKAENAAMQNIFPNLSRNLRSVWQARVLVEARANPSNPPDHVRAMLPEQANILSAPDWQRNRALAAARRLDFCRLARCMEIVAHTDARLKGMEASSSPTEALDRMVLEMVEAVRR